MKRRTVAIVGLATTLVVGLTLAFAINRAKSAKANAFQAELALARKEGLPTSAEEFASIIKPARPEENAAPLYRTKRLQGKEFVDVKPAVLCEALLKGGKADIERARKVLRQFARDLADADKAVKLPRCWFDRDWKPGPAVLFSELATMKGLANLLAVRGSLAAAEGRVQDAISDAAKMQRIALHAHEEPTMIAHLVSDAITATTMRWLASWAFTYRDKPEYAQALKSAIDARPRPDLKLEYRCSLYNILALIELVKTPEGRASIGLRDEDVPPAEKFFPLIIDADKAKVDLVKANRAMWAALDKPLKQRSALMQTASHEIFKALLAYPTAAKVYEILEGSDPYGMQRPEIWLAQVQQYEAVYRAVRERKVPKSIEVGDLKSPFDGKPLKYVFDGKQIVVEVNGYTFGSQKTALKVPRKP